MTPPVGHGRGVERLAALFPSISVPEIEQVQDAARRNVALYKLAPREAERMVAEVAERTLRQRVETLANTIPRQPAPGDAPAARTIQLD